MAKCEIKEIEKKELKIRLFDEEIEQAKFVCLALNLSYEEFFMKMI